MANTLIPGRLESQFEALARKKSRITQQENKLVEKFDACTDPEIIKEALESIIEFGQPKQINQAKCLKERYEMGNFLFDDVWELNKLYRTVGKCLSNKENEDE